MNSTLKMIISGIVLAISLISCRTSEEPTIEANIENNLTIIKTFSNDTHNIELYTKTGQLGQGYQDISIRIKNKVSGQYEKNATLSWLPMMHMISMSHSCPRSEIKKANADGTLYNGYIVFTMGQNASEYWDIKIDYTINGNSYTATSVLDVPVASKRNINSFTGTDSNKYIMSLIEPTTSKTGTNDFVVGVWKNVGMNNFETVNAYTIKIDPRMPSMGNHSSPNNVNATQSSGTPFYTGKLSLTMSGYWKINLQYADTSGNILKGEEVTESNPASSIFFELEY